MRRGMWLSLCMLFLWNCYGGQLQVAAIMDEEQLGVMGKLETHTSTPAKCWIFTHLQKSGGTTVKRIIGEREGESFAIYDTWQWLLGSAVAKKYAEALRTHESEVIAGGYAEALRPYVGNECRWFTMFRHPISRLVSAYYYCHGRPQDPLCGHKIVEAKDITLVEFARHWGNFAVRQFALNYINPDDVVNFVKAGGVVREQGDELNLPGWYLLKAYLEHQGSLAGKDEAGVMMDMLHPIRNLIRENITVVAVLEDFERSLHMFNKALGMTGLDWKAAFETRGVFKSNKKYHDVAKDSLRKAWTNSEIKDYMALDLLLYEHAIDVSREQAERYGLL